MSYLFHQDEGTRTTNRQINGIAAGVMTTNAALAGPVIGDIIEIFVGANTGYYTLIATPGANQYTLRPTPANQGASGVLATARLNRNADRGISLAPTTITALTSNLALIYAPGANFVTQDVRRNDRLVLIGSATAANNGGWYIQEVINADYVVVRPPDGGAGMATDAAPGGTLTVRLGEHGFEILNEAAITMDALRGATPKVAPTNFFGSGAASDYIRKKTVSANNRVMYQFEGMGPITIDQSGLGGGSEWTAQNEIWVVGNAGVALPVNKVVGVWAGPLVFKPGTTEGDDVSADNGCVIIGGPRFTMTAAADFRVEGYGSYYDSNGLQQNDGTLVGCIVRGSVGTVALAGAVGRALVLYGAQPLQVTGAVDFQNIVLTEATLAPTIAQPAAIGGLLVSANAVSPSFNYTYSGGPEPLEFIDPQEDYDLATLVVIAFTSGFADKQYTYNPKYVVPSVTVPPTVAPTGSRVVITEVNETDLTEQVVFDGLTDVNGNINAGAGVMLRRQSGQRTSVPDPTLIVTNYTHRLDFPGSGFGSYTIQLRGTVTGDRPLGQLQGQLTDGITVVEVATPEVTVEVESGVVTVDRADGTVEVEVL